MQRFLIVLCGALFVCVSALAQSPMSGFPPGTFQSRAPLDAAPAGSSLTFTATDVATAWQTGITPPATFTNMAAGSASSDRILVAVIAVEGNALNGIISAVTIGGVVATKNSFIDSGAAGQGVYIYSAPVPTGTTATVIIACTGFPSGIGVALGKITGSATTAFSAQNTVGPSAVADPHSITTTVPANGVGIVGVNVDRALTPSWTNATGDANITEVGGGALALLMAHTANNSPSFTGANGFSLAIVAATYAP